MVSNIFYFHPYLGKIPILTNIFQWGWNHQLVYQPGVGSRCFLVSHELPSSEPQRLMLCSNGFVHVMMQQRYTSILMCFLAWSLGDCFSWNGCMVIFSMYIWYVFDFLFAYNILYIYIQREKLGTLGRVPEICTNIYHLYMGYITVV